MGQHHSSTSPILTKSAAACTSLPFPQRPTKPLCPPLTYIHRKWSSYHSWDYDHPIALGASILNFRGSWGADVERVGELGDEALPGRTYGGLLLKHSHYLHGTGRGGGGGATCSIQ